MALEQVPLNEADLAIGAMGSGRITSIKTQLVEFCLVFETFLASLWNAFLFSRDMPQETILQDLLKDTFDQLLARYETTV